MDLDRNTACSISLLELHEQELPVVTECGHLFETKELEHWLSCNNSCPNCKRPIDRQELSIEPLLNQGLLSEQQKQHWLQAVLDKKNDSCLLLLMQHDIMPDFNGSELLQQFRIAIREKRHFFAQLMFYLPAANKEYLMFYLINSKEYNLAAKILTKHHFEHLADYQFVDGSTMLHRAIEVDNLNLAYSLLEAGHKREVSNEKGQSIIALAASKASPVYSFIMSNQLEQLKVLIANNNFTALKTALKTLTIPPFILSRFLFVCMQKGQTRAAALFIKYGADLRYDKSISIPAAAALYGYNEFIRYLDPSHQFQAANDDGARPNPVFYSLEDNFYLRYIIDLSQTAGVTAGHWKKSLNFNAIKLFKHARGDNQFLMFNKGTRTREILHDMQVMSANGTPTEHTPDTLRPYCRQ